MCLGGLGGLGLAYALDTKRNAFLRQGNFCGMWHWMACVRASAEAPDWGVVSEVDTFSHSPRSLDMNAASDAN